MKLIPNKRIRTKYYWGYSDDDGAIKLTKHSRIGYRGLPKKKQKTRREFQIQLQSDRHDKDPRHRLLWKIELEEHKREWKELMWTEGVK